jgi:hypothetical protein
MAAETDKGEGLRMLISRAGGTPVKTVAQLDSSGASQVIIYAPCTVNAQHGISNTSCDS